jgi:hypothetical protein
MKRNCMVLLAAVLLPFIDVAAKKVGKLKPQSDLVMAAVMKGCNPNRACKKRAYASVCRTDSFFVDPQTEIDFFTKATSSASGIILPTSGSNFATDGFTIKHKGTYLIQYFLRPAQSESSPDINALPLFEIRINSNSGLACSRFGSPQDFNLDTTGSIPGIPGTLTLLDVSGSVVLPLNAGDMVHLFNISTDPADGRPHNEVFDSVFVTNPNTKASTSVVSAYITIRQLI